MTYRAFTYTKTGVRENGQIGETLRVEVAMKIQPLGRDSVIRRIKGRRAVRDARQKAEFVAQTGQLTYRGSREISAAEAKLIGQGFVWKY